ncbi:FKBP-type peptidyl-prolyl cis-trans isomerase [Gillisia sp. JM1]|uniref:FKBP-type peptidyl-prolyl cis-trans isomerase n=1 Tax=Gillisia sp. JM1 TaxID=1283286 RepID=UPI001E3809F0|nr:hypothetical protein [Gillisia sp. JM1]
MMRLTKLFILMVLTSISIISCKKDDDNEPEPVPIRDLGEQAIEDDEALISYLQTHFYNEEDFQNPAEGFDYRIKFDSIAGSNIDKTPLIDSDLLATKVVTRNEVDYNIYILKIREGFGEHPTFADSTFQNYKGELLNQISFDNTANPVWFDHPGTRTQGNPGIAVVALTETLVEFGGASNFSVNDDNTVQFTDDFGVGAVFLPSGLGYFSGSQGSIPAYSPLIFSFQLYKVNQADHDQDGIPSYLEDLDNDRIVANDDSDENRLPNYLDADDDGDGTLTKDEIIINADGSIVFPDKNGNGIPNYLDPEEFENVNEI